MKRNIAVLILAIVVFVSACGEKEFEMNSNETSAYLWLRVEIAESKTHFATASFGTKEFIALGELAKRYGGDWFKNSSGNFVGNTNDTASREIVYISDGIWTATFYVVKGDERYILQDYSFEQKATAGSPISIS